MVVSLTDSALDSSKCYSDVYPLVQHTDLMQVYLLGKNASLAAII